MTHRERGHGVCSFILNQFRLTKSSTTSTTTTTASTTTTTTCLKLCSHLGFAKRRRAAGMSRSRLVVPKDLDVSQIQDALEAWMAKKGSRDLATLLGDLVKHTSWKSAPRAETLAQYSDLYLELVKVTPTAILPAKKTMLAICALHRARPVNFTSKPLDVWSDEMSLALRAGLQKYRELSKDSEAHRRCLCKAFASTSSWFVVEHCARLCQICSLPNCVSLCFDRQPLLVFRQQCTSSIKQML